MIADTDEFIAIDNFANVGVVTTDTFNTWRKKDNGVIHALGSFIENSSSQAIDVSGTVISLKNSGVLTVHIADANITTNKLANLSVTTTKIANAAITPDKIATDAVSTAKIATNAITTIKITDLNVTTAKLADLAVTTNKIAALSVTTDKIANLAVTTAKIENGNVTTAKLADSAVTADKIAGNAVTESKILDGNVTTNKLANLGITFNKIGDGAVIASKIADGNVTTNKLANLGVTNEKIANLAITSSKIGGNGIPKQVVWNSMASNLAVSGGWSGVFSSTITVGYNGSKVRVQATIHGSTGNAGVPMGLRIVCNGNVIDESIGNSSSSRINASAAISTPNDIDIACVHIDFLHARDAGTYTYELQARTTGGVNGFFNRSRADDNNNATYRTRCSIVLTEIT